MAKAKTNLPETPFNGIVVSVVRGEVRNHTCLYFAIADEDAGSANPTFVYYTLYCDNPGDHRVHVQKGHKVKVVDVWQGYDCLDCRIEFDATQLLTDKLTDTRG